MDPITIDFLKQVSLPFFTFILSYSNFHLLNLLNPK